MLAQYQDISQHWLRGESTPSWVTHTTPCSTVFLAPCWRIGTTMWDIDTLQHNVVVSVRSKLIRGVFANKGQREYVPQWLWTPPVTYLSLRIAQRFLCASFLDCDLEIWLLPTTPTQVPIVLWTPQGPRSSDIKSYSYSPMWIQDQPRAAVPQLAELILLNTI